MQMKRSTVIERKGVIYISNYDLQDFNDSATETKITIYRDGLLALSLRSQ